MSILEKYSAAIKNKDEATMNDLLHDDFKFTMHKTGNSLGKADVIKWAMSGDINQDNSYKVKNIIKEDSKSEILELLDYSSKTLVESIIINSESAFDQKHLTIKEARKLIDQIETSLRKSSYLSE